MRQLCIFFAAAFLIASSSGDVAAQIPNGDFESWQLNSPTDWVVDNIPFLVEPVTKTTEAHSGKYALRAAVIVTPFTGDTVPPTGTTGHLAGTTLVAGFPYSGSPTALRGFCKFTSVGGDAFTIAATFRSGGATIGGGLIGGFQSSESYQSLTGPILINPLSKPDTASVSFLIIPGQGAKLGHVGTVLLIDDLTFGSIFAVDHPSQASHFLLQQNFPNPFNPSTTTRYSLSERAWTSLTILDVNGQIVKTAVNHLQESGMHEVAIDMSSFASGVYYYRLVSGGHASSRLMLFLK